MKIELLKYSWVFVLVTGLQLLFASSASAKDVFKNAHETILPLTKLCLKTNGDVTREFLADNLARCYASQIEEKKLDLDKFSKSLRETCDFDKAEAAALIKDPAKECS